MPKAELSRDSAKRVLAPDAENESKGYRNQMPDQGALWTPYSTNTNLCDTLEQLDAVLRRHSLSEEWTARTGWHVQPASKHRDGMREMLTMNAGTCWIHSNTTKPPPRNTLRSCKSIVEDGATPCTGGAVSNSLGDNPIAEEEKLLESKKDAP